jgi:hypothetical protein
MFSVSANFARERPISRTVCGVQSSSLALTKSLGLRYNGLRGGARDSRGVSVCGAHASAGMRRRFADEMLRIDDEAERGASEASLFADVLVSLSRQWLLRSDAWKTVVVPAGALLQVTIGGILWLGSAPTGAVRFARRLVSGACRDPAAGSPGIGGTSHRGHLSRPVVARDRVRGNRRRNCFGTNDRPHPSIRS